MAVLAPPVQVVASGAPPFVQVPSGAPPFVVTTGPAPPIMIVASGAPPITLFNDDGSLWAAGGAAVGGAALLVGEANGFATDFLHPVDAERVALKTSGSTLAYAVNSFYQQAGTSPKMVYDASGVLGWSPHNTVLQSQTFADANWLKENVALTVATAPDGTATASKIACTITAPLSNYGLLYNFGSGTITTIAGEIYTISIYAKAAEMSWLGIEGINSNVSESYFNLATGTLGTKYSGHTGYAITPAGNGWYRCSISFIPGAGTTPKFHARSADGQAPNGPGVAGEGMYLWGAQLNRGSVPTAYLPTTTAARVGLALDYDPVTHAAKGLLCEPQATNLAIMSQDLAHASWALGAATVSANATTAPDGTVTADKLVEDGTAAQHMAYKGVTTTAVAHAVSVYVKAAERSWMYIGVQAFDVYAWFDVGTGAVGTVDAGATAAIKAVGNGWYRCEIRYTASSTSPYFVLGTATGNNAKSFTGDPTKGIYLWGMQMETGTVATSPIPTLAATVTRAGDQVSVTPASINYSATAGSWWVEQYHKVLVAGGRTIGYGSPNTPMLQESAGTFALYDAGYLYCFTVGSLPGVIRKVACAFQAGSRAMAEGGQAANTDAGSTATLLAPTEINIGCSSVGAQMNGYIRKLRYLPRRPTNAELSAMTL